MQLGEICVRTPSQEDSAPGSVLIQSVAASGSALPEAAGRKLPMGSSAQPWEHALPRPKRPLSPALAAGDAPLAAAGDAAGTADEAAVAGPLMLTSAAGKTATLGATLVGTAATAGMLSPMLCVRLPPLTSRCRQRLLQLLQEIGGQVATEDWLQRRDARVTR